MNLPPGRVELCLGRGLVTVGIVCLTWCAVTIAEGARWQNEQRKRFDQTVDDSGSSGSQAHLSAVPETGYPIGTIELPRLRLSAVVVEGDDDAALKKGIGHLPDTPLPWQPGNSAFAGHRDTFFRRLKDVKLGDVVRVNTPHGRFEYRVRRAVIVDPEDIWVLDATDRNTVTLITCYPFFYIGNAPRRFVVTAERIEPAPRADGGHP